MVQLTQQTRRSTVGRSSRYLEEALYKRLFRKGSDEKSIRTELNQFLASRKKVHKWEVGVSIRKLRQRKRYSPALKLSEAMAKRGMNLTLSDHAICLDLVAKTRGISAAEEYFMQLPDVAKNHLTYGALLNCYCKELMTEKAETLMEKMKELNFTCSSMSYNSLMTLYTKTGNPERVPSIIQEMKASEIMPDCFTYNIWMRALAAANDIYGVERVFDEMKRDGRVTEDWTTYSNLASIYINSGMLEKAEMSLKELEKKNTRRDLDAFQFLITLYGRTGNLVELYRIWQSLKKAFPKMANVSYLNMMQALVKLNDLPFAEKCFREWESFCETYDIRIANVMIDAYAGLDMIDTAHKIRKYAASKGAKPNSKTWEIFMNYNLKKGHVKAAVQCIADAIGVGRGDGRKWYPSADVVQKVMRYFEDEKDVDGAERFVEILDKGECEKGKDVFVPLIRTYAAAGRKYPMIRQRLKMENVDVSEAYQEMLNVLCAEF